MVGSFSSIGDNRAMLFDSTVRKELARSFGATLMVILTIFMTNLVIRTLGLAANGAVARAGRRLHLHAAGAADAAHHPVAVAVHRRHPHARAHVPRERDGDLVLQRHRPGALHPPGARDELAGDRAGRHPDAVRLAVELQPVQRPAPALRAARRRAARLAGPVPVLGRRPPRVLRREGGQRGRRRRAQRVHHERRAARANRWRCRSRARSRTSATDRFLVARLRPHGAERQDLRRAHARRVQELPRARRHQQRRRPTARPRRAPSTPPTCCWAAAPPTWASSRGAWA